MSGGPVRSATSRQKAKRLPKNTKTTNHNQDNYHPGTPQQPPRQKLLRYTEATTTAEATQVHRSNHHDRSHPGTPKQPPRQKPPRHTNPTNTTAATQVSDTPTRHPSPANSAPRVSDTLLPPPMGTLWPITASLAVLDGGRANWRAGQPAQQASGAWSCARARPASSGPWPGRRGDSRTQTKNPHPSSGIIGSFTPPAPRRFPAPQPQRPRHGR